MTTKQLLDKLDQKTKSLENNERVLFLLLKEYEEQITGLIEQDEFKGGWFHKAFRQTDVTNSGKIDSAIWMLISQSEIFWKVVKNIK